MAIAMEQRERDRIGLCASCRQVRAVTSGKGSVFWLCRRSETDPRYPRYPMLPVRRCAGHEPGDPHPLPPRRAG